MPTNRTKRKRTSNNTIIDDSIEEFFLTGAPERGTAGWDLRTSRFFDNGLKILTVWLEHRDYLLSKWKREKRSSLSYAEKNYDEIA